MRIQLQHEREEKRSFMQERDSLLEERNALRTQLDSVRAERTEMRTYLQLADTQDPRDVVKLLDQLNVSIRNSCTFASRAVLKSVRSKDLWTTKDMEQLRIHLGDVSALLLSERGERRKPEDFLPKAFRFAVNLTLVNLLFAKFHPKLPSDQDRLLLNIYQDIRRRGWLKLSSHPWNKSLISFLQILSVSPLDGAASRTRQ
jgi:hypothetical protein